MPDTILVDNDVALKVCIYDLAEAFAALLYSAQPALVLTTAQYVIENRIQKSSRVRDRARARRAMQAFFSRTETIEPDASEISLAAELEESASKSRLELDGGESLLFALLAKRALRLLVTGDKRAIQALEQISATLDLTSAVAGKLACFEQAVATLLQLTPDGEVAKAICAEPDADKALAICFRCASQNFDLRSAIEGLASYIVSVRSTASTLLCASDDLNFLISNKDGVR